MQATPSGLGADLERERQIRWKEWVRCEREALVAKTRDVKVHQRTKVQSCPISDMFVHKFVELIYLSRTTQ